MEIITIIQNGLAIIGGIVTLLGIIAPLTNTEWDDKLLLKLKSFLNKTKVNKKNKSILISLKE